jgi:hypothetical protein
MHYHWPTKVRMMNCKHLEGTVVGLFQDLHGRTDDCDKLRTAGHRDEMGTKEEWRVRRQSFRVCLKMCKVRCPCAWQALRHEGIWGIRCRPIAQFILNLANRWSLVINFTSRPLDLRKGAHDTHWRAPVPIWTLWGREKIPSPCRQ